MKSVTTPTPRSSISSICPAKLNCPCLRPLLCCKRRLHFLCGACLFPFCQFGKKKHNFITSLRRGCVCRQVQVDYLNILPPLRQLLFANGRRRSGLLAWLLDRLFSRLRAQLGAQPRPRPQRRQRVLIEAGREGAVQVEQFGFVGGERGIIRAQKES